jgi:predicted phage gp36 major capsid-like protein
MENARYAMNDDTAGFINQMKTQVGKLSMIWN